MMTTIITQFKTHEDAEAWAAKQGLTVILSSKSIDGNIKLTVMEK